MVMDYFKGTSDYVISPELQDSVNISIALGRPLVVKGEPGTGKTLLAHAIAKALDKKLFIWNIKSTTKAHEGLYVYDTVKRLNDARFGDHDVQATDWPRAHDHNHIIQAGFKGLLVHVMLVLPDTNRFGVDFDQLSQGIHQTPANGDSTSYGDIQVRKLGPGHL